VELKKMRLVRLCCFSLNVEALINKLELLSSVWWFGK